MTTTAIIMMIIAILTIWGGLALAVLNLHKNGNVSQRDLDDVEFHQDP